MSHDHDHHQGGSGGHFYKGLFFGLILGVGLAYFLKTKEGQEVKRQLLGKGEDLVDEVSSRVIEFLEQEPTP